MYTLHTLCHMELCSNSNQKPLQNRKLHGCCRSLAACNLEGCHPECGWQNDHVNVFRSIYGGQWMGQLHRIPAL